MSNYALRVPDSLFEAARKLAEEDQTSMNQFFVTAIAEKISALETERFFRERGQIATRKNYLKALDRIPAAGPEPEPNALYAQEPRRRMRMQKNKLD
jgi:hypothetical protein